MVILVIELPVVHRWPYDFSVPGAKEDFIPQTTPPSEVVEYRGRKNLKIIMSDPKIEGYNLNQVLKEWQQTLAQIKQCLKVYIGAKQ